MKVQVSSSDATLTTSLNADGSITLTVLPKPVTNLSAIWANDGGDKVVRSELRASRGANVINSVWTGFKIVLSAGRNEVTNFNLILEAANTAASKVSISFSSLTGPGGAVIASQPATGDSLFNWTQRPIELFYVRYLQIKGLSFFGYQPYDERQIPTKLRRPFSPTDFRGVGTGLWTDRPNHDAFYPDIAVPLELVPTFAIAAGSNQSIWCDIYVPKSAAPGLYTGTVTISEGTLVTHVPVELTVRKFTLPDVPSAKSMLFLSGAEINTRFVGRRYLPTGDPGVAAVMPVYDRFFLMAHRHKLQLIGEVGWIDEDVAGGDQPGKSTLKRLLGSFYTAANGYDGPGVGQPNDIYSIGTYGTWTWDKTNEAAMWKHTDAWEQWFQANAPAIEHFLYLIDEPGPAAYSQVEQWAAWMKANPGPGRALASMATVTMIAANNSMPSLNAPTFPAGLAPKVLTQAAFQALRAAGKRIYAYGGERPCSGSETIEDEGAALRSRPWMQFKFGLSRWFQWYANGWPGIDAASASNVFQVANTFGTISGVDPIKGEWGGSNGDGNLFYPGTDKLFPADSYGLNGPIASLRLKHWRRGVQDADYLAMAKAIDPVATAAIVQRMVPVALWEVDVFDVNDPTYQYGGPSWPINADAWEQARADLAAIIER
jgi:hypothetical protein